MTERIPTEHGTEGQPLDQFDEAMAEFLARPSWTAIFLHTIAHELEVEQPHQPLITSMLTAAMSWASSDVFEEVDETIANEARRLAVAMLPAERPGETQIQYAAKLRAAARTV